MDNTRKLWIGLATLLGISFAILLLVGGQIHRKAPPMPERVAAADGTTVFERADIERGRSVWQSIGGQQLGSIWGHGGYVAPDWTADWLHREAVALLDVHARRSYGRPHAELGAGERAEVEARVKTEMRANGHDAERDVVTISPARAEAIAAVAS